MRVRIEIEYLNLDWYVFTILHEHFTLKEITIRSPEPFLRPILLQLLNRVFLIY